jgi:pimeloyl-ACP methyl ester carboxylesterase
MDVVAEAAHELRAHGAERIVVGGHSLGANATLGYAVLRDDVVGVVVLSPGHFPDLRGSQERVQASIAKAHAMVVAGKGDEAALFEDLNVGRMGDVRTTGANYLSYWDPDGHAVMARNAAALPPGTPLLWVVGEDDPLAKRVGRDYAFAKAPPHPLNRYFVVSGGHLEAPAVAAPDVVGWLKCL